MKPGSHLGPYRVERKVADGGSGAVYEAFASDGHRVAVKLLRVLDAETVARFDRERRLLASLGERDGFVPLLDAGSAAEGPWLAMPFLEGGTLRDRLRAHGRLEPDAALALGRELARALARAHSLGIVHRDLKPENVLFTHRGAESSAARALIADLGLAKHFGATGAAVGASITRQDVLAGTIGYMAPEQVEDARSASAAADVFALGAILYECLAGELPFEARGVLSFVQSVSGGRPRSLRARGVAIPAAIDRAILRALERDPKLRFPDGLAFGRALEAPAESRRASVLSVAILAVAAAIVGAVALTRSPPPGPRPAVPTSPAPVTAPRAPATATPPGPVARRIEDAEAALEARPPRYAEAYEVANAIVERSNFDPRALAARAAAALGLRDLKQAYDDGYRAVKIEETATRWALLAEICHARLAESRSYAELERKALDDAVRLGPERGDYWFRRGIVRASYQADFEGALGDFEQALRLDDRNVNYIQHRAWMLAVVGRKDTALVELDRALALDPRSLLALRWRSELREAAGDADGAIRDMEQIVALEPAGGSQREQVEPRLERLKRRLGR